MRTVLTILFACLQIFLFAQTKGARSAGMAGLNLGLSDLFSAINNQAMLPEIKSISAGLTIQNQYLVKNLNTAALAVAVPIGNGAAGIFFSTYGYQLYRQNKLGLSYALAFSPVFSMGLSINYSSIQLGDGLGMQYAFYPDLGLNYKPTEKLNIGLQFQNLTQSKKVKQLNELWPVTGRLGLIYFINEKLIIGAQGNVYIHEPFEINSGLEYNISSYFSLRFGFATQPTRASMGIGFQLQNFHVDIASSYQAILGFTPSVNLNFISGN